MPACANCGFNSEAGFRFCPSCGAGLAAAAPSREQRKTVTVLFCDLTGSTTLGETLDPERLRALLARYFDRMKTIVERHGGSVEKFIGDAVMAVFGVPVLHEDDALRAVRAAIEMRDAIEGGVDLELGGFELSFRRGENATREGLQIGFRLETASEVDAWAQELGQRGFALVAPPSGDKWEGIRCVRVVDPEGRQVAVSYAYAD